MHGFEVVDDVSAPVSEMTTLWAIAAEPGEEDLVWETAGVHAVEVSQPSESVGSQNIFDCADVAALSEGFVRDVAVRCEADAEDVADAAHLERFKASHMPYKRSPCFRAVQECWKHGAFEDSDFGFGGDLFSSVEDRLQSPEVVGSLLETGVDFVVETGFA